MKHTIPPAIRVFISSTFSDMLNERKYFNTVLDPELSRLCASRGVSFFAVDLRWGITEEQANNGEVIPMCLREIDHCRPFFIGIIGNRYGSTLAEIGLKDDGQFPWLAGRENKSATELEMLYGVLECEEGKECPDCLFMLRSDELSAENFKGTESEEKRRCVEELRKRVTEQEDIPCEDYNSLEEFGEKIIRQFTIWLDENFPSTDSAAKARHDFYNGELMRNYVELKETEEFINRFCQYGDRPLLICGSGPRGKTSLLTHWEPAEGRKILINVESDPAYLYWPKVAHELLEELGCEPDEFPGYFSTEDDLDDFRLDFLDQLIIYDSETPVYIVINDIDKMQGAKAEYLSWLPPSLPENLHIICAAGDPTIAETAKLLDWIVQELPELSDAQQVEFLRGCLEMYGKSLSSEQEFLILASEAVYYAGNIKLIIRFLNQYASFESLNDISRQISECMTSEELYQYIWNYACAGFSPELKKSAEVTAYCLSSCSVALSEEELYACVNSLTETGRIEWSNISILLDLFGINKNDTWKINDASIRAFFEEMPVDTQKAEVLLSEYYLSLLNTPGNTAAADTPDAETERKKILYAKAAIGHMLKAKDYARVVSFLNDTSITDRLVDLELDFVRSAWMQVLLYSDEDVEGLLLTDLNQMKISLLYDLGFVSTAYRESEKNPDLSLLSNMKHRYMSSVRKDVFDHYIKLCELFNAGQYMMVADIVGNITAGGYEEFYPYEIFLFLYKAAESLASLGNPKACLEMAQKAYKEAILSMSDYDVMCTIKMIGFCYGNLSRIPEAKAHFRFVTQRAKALGDTRDYLEALSHYANCEMREGDGNISIPRFCEKIWTKLHSPTSIIDSIMEAARFLRKAGQLQEACDEIYRAVEAFKEFSDDLTGSQDLQINIMTDLANLKEEMGEVEEAEKYYLFARKMFTGLAGEQFLPQIYNGLLRIYDKKKMISRSAETHDEYADLLYKYGDIDNAEKEIWAAHIAYLEAGLKEDCAAFDKKWKERSEEDSRLDLDLENIGTAENTADTPDSRASSDAASQWEKKLLVARSEGDQADIVDILVEGISLFRIAAPSRSRKLCLEALEILQSLGELDSYASVRLVNAVLFLVLPEDDPERKAFFTGYSVEDLELFDIWAEMIRCEYDDPDYEPLLQAILECKELKDVRLYCILQQAETILSFYNGYAPSIIKKIKDDKGRTFFIRHAAQIYSDLMESQFGNMRNDPLSPEVSKMLEYFTDAVNTLLEGGSTKVGFIAGDMAVILRKRGEYELAFKYHGISSKAYLDEGNLREYFVERINLAQTCLDTEEYEKASDILFDVLDGDLPIDDYPRQRALAFGALTHVFMDPLDPDEILPEELEESLFDCFEEEENYFRDTEEPYDLAVSLVNQLQYLRRDPAKHWDMIRSKFDEAVQLARDHSMSNIMEFLTAFADSFKGGE